MRAHRVRWLPRALLALLLGAVSLGLLGPSAASGAAAATAATTAQLVQKSRTLESGVSGPATLRPARFGRPTVAGHLLVASVLCGILTAGMKVPALSLPAPWRLAARRVGGIRGGLEAAVYFYPDAPPGLTSVPLDADHQTSVPSGSVAYCSTLLWEIAGVGTANRLDATGSTSAVQGNELYSTPVAVRTTSSTSHRRDLVVMAETDGSSVAQSLYSVSPPYVLESQVLDGHVHQPGTASLRTNAPRGPQSGWVTQQSNWLDECLVIAALTTSAAPASSRRSRP